MLKHEVTVQQDGLDLRQHAVVAIEVRPARLHHAHLRLGKVVNHLHEPVGRWNKIGVEDGDKLAVSYFETRIERPGLIAVPVGAMDVDNGMAERCVAGHNARGHFGRLIGRIVEHLDFKLFTRVLDGAHRIHQPVNDKLLVEDGQLDGHVGQFVKVPGRIGVVVLAEFKVVVAQRVAMNAVEREQDHDREIRQQHGGVEPVPVVEPFEGLIGELRLQIMTQTIGRGKRQQRRHPDAAEAVKTD